MHTHPIIIIGGPTASGKSCLAQMVAKKYRGTIINADSIQLYQGASLLSAHPDHTAQQEVPHVLYGIFPPSHHSSVAEWLRLACDEINRCHQSGSIPIVTGGTGLYIKALIYGLSPLPEISEKLAQEYRDQYDLLSTEQLYQRLSLLDQELGAIVKPADRQRIMRGLMVKEITGRSLVYYQSLAQEPLFPLHSIIGFFVHPPRHELYQYIEQRFRSMLDAGALDEVKQIMSLSLDPALPLMKTLGLKELQAYLMKQCTLEDAALEATKATRHYAKRQITWFRHQCPDLQEINSSTQTEREAMIMTAIESFLTNDNTVHS